MSNVVTLSQVNGYTGQQLALIKNTVAADCNPMEFDLFMAVAQSKGLDPFTKQIHAVVYNKDKPLKRKMSIITGIDGFRAIAERTGAYRPDEDEPEFTYDPAEKGPLNPLGLVKAVVRIWKNEKRATGVAYWTEFAPIKDEWAENDAGKYKPTGKQTLDTGGQWGKMPRVMLAKCAEAQALRKAFPEQLSGLYEAAEFDRTKAAELLPSEQVAIAATEDRLLRIGGGRGLLFQFEPNGALEGVQLGQVFDRISQSAGAFTSVKHLEWFTSINREPLKEYWARAQTDALALKKVIEDRKAALIAADKATSAELQAG